MMQQSGSSAGARGWWAHPYSALLHDGGRQNTHPTLIMADASIPENIRSLGKCFYRKRREHIAAGGAPFDAGMGQVEANNRASDKTS
ncbi:hypothetical protein V8J88_15300 [Massilia sp. W12]|uniref:hypothetical protein n=1 Tax=Massilia sp. W12 TaxID=3126507 RepID=UPI0030CFE422